MATKYQNRNNSLDFSDSQESDNEGSKFPLKSSLGSSKMDLKSSQRSYESHDDSPLKNELNNQPKSILKETSDKIIKPSDRIKINDLINGAQANNMNKLDDKLLINNKDDNLETKARETASFKNFDKGSKGLSYGSLNSDKYNQPKDLNQDKNSFDSSSDEKEKSPIRLKNIYSKEIKQYKKGEESESSDFSEDSEDEENRSQKINDYTKEKVQNAQKFREQQLYTKTVKDSAEKVRQKWLEEKSRSRDEGLVYPKESITTDQKPDILETHKQPSAETFSRIETRLDRLERDLNEYAKATDKAEEQVEIIENDHRLISEKFNKLKKDLENSFEREKEKRLGLLDNHKESIRGSYNKNKEVKTTTTIASEIDEDSKNKKKPKGKNHSVSNTSSIRNKSYSMVSANEEAMEQLEKLKEENRKLKQKLKEKENYVRHTPKAKKYGLYEVDLDSRVEKEKELLKMIDRIKNKLRQSIAKKLLKDQENHVKEVKEAAEIKAFGRNYKSYANSKKSFNKSTYTSPKNPTTEASYLLYKGAPSTYYSQHSKTYQSLGSRNSKKSDYQSFLERDYSK